jgi:hypothetical protein
MLFVEERRYEPPDDSLLRPTPTRHHERDFEKFWETEGRERITWFRRSTACWSGSACTRSGI